MCVTNVLVPLSQWVVSAGAAGPQCVPSHCPAGWPAAPSSLSAAQTSTTANWVQKQTSGNTFNWTTFFMDSITFHLTHCMYVIAQTFNYSVCTTAVSQRVWGGRKIKPQLQNIRGKWRGRYERDKNEISGDDVRKTGPRLSSSACWKNLHRSATSKSPQGWREAVHKLGWLLSQMLQRFQCRSHEPMTAMHSDLGFRR